MLLRATLFLLLVAGTVLACHLSPSAQAGTSAGVVMKLPAQLSGLTARPELPDADEKRLLPDDTEFAKATFSTTTPNLSERDVIRCTIVLSGAERRSIHRPEVCLVGQGWTIMDSRIIPLSCGDGREIAVKDLYIEKIITLKSGERRPIRAHYVYWFVGADVTTPSHVERIWLTIRDNLVRNLNHRWAYPSLMAIVTDNFTPAESGERVRSSEETLHLLTGFIQKLVPQIQKEFMEDGAE